MEAAILIKISLQEAMGQFFNVSMASSVCWGVGLRHMGKVNRNLSSRPCPWSRRVIRRAANGTCVDPRIQNVVFVPISLVLSVAYR